MGKYIKEFERENLKDKIAIITGANSGLGYHTALSLADQNATVIMACRDLEKSEKERQNLIDITGNKNIELMKIDLSDLDSVSEFVHVFIKKYGKLDVLVNNAGVLIPPYTKTKQGFELQFGVNHLAHFALTAQLFNLLIDSEYARIVTISSLASHRYRIQFEDINWEKKYRDFDAYSMSKLANLMFAMELNDKIQEKNLNIKSIAAHPGLASTELFEDGKNKMNKFIASIAEKVFMGLFAQSASQGALPQIYAALSPKAESGKFYGPDGWREYTGYPKEAKIAEKAKIKKDRQKLWNLSEEMTGIEFVL